MKSSPNKVPANLERRKSIEDYQRQIINRIKDHFQRSRDEWQRKLHPQQSKKLERVNNGSALDLVNQTSCNQCPQDRDDKTTTGRSCPSRSPSVRIISCNAVSGSEETSVQVVVDISEFLPDGEVTFRTQKNGLLVCAKFPAAFAAAAAAKSCSDSSAAAAAEKVKVIPVPGLIESERIRVLPASQHGAMILQLKVAATKQ